MAGLLQSAAVAHNRRRPAEAGPGGRDERPAEIPQDFPAVRLRAEPAVRREEGLLLPGGGRVADQVSGQVEGAPIPAYGRPQPKDNAKVSSSGGLMGKRAAGTQTIMIV